MKKLRIILASTLTAFTLLSAIAPLPVMAADPISDVCDQAPRSPVCTSTTTDNPLFGEDGIITRATQIVAMVAGIAAVIMIIIGGLKYILSSGDSANVENAKNTILYAVIGLAIALVAELIVLFVMRRL